MISKRSRRKRTFSHFLKNWKQRPIDGPTLIEEHIRVGICAKFNFERPVFDEAADGIDNVLSSAFIPRTECFPMGLTPAGEEPGREKTVSGLASLKRALENLINARDQLEFVSLHNPRADDGDSVFESWKNEAFGGLQAIEVLIDSIERRLGLGARPCFHGIPDTRDHRDDRRVELVLTLCRAWDRAGRFENSKDCGIRDGHGSLFDFINYILPSLTHKSLKFSMSTINVDVLEYHERKKLRAEISTLEI